MLKRTIILLSLLLLSVPSFAAPKKRAKSEQPQSVTVTIYDTVRVVITDTVKVVVKEVVKPAQRIDTLLHLSQTPSQIDSLMEIWTKINQEQSNKRYFERYSKTTTREAQMPKDSLYRKRLQDMVSPVQLPYNSIVRDYIDGYLKGIWSNMSQTLAISRYYFPIIEEELQAAGLPLELRYLAVVESNLTIRAGSRAGAMGLWQIMPSTGESAGLEVNSLVDERCDVIKSTKAAIKFLKYLYKLYGDWSLAIAAYNCGGGTVNRAIASVGGKCNSFWDIYDLLPHETRCYVPKFIGAAYAFTYHKAHNIVPAETPGYVPSDTVTIKRALHLGQVASTLNIPLKTLQDLNPQYKLDIIPATRKSYTLRLPMRYISEFTAKEKEIYSKEKQYLKEYMNPDNLDKKRTPIAKPAEVSYTYVVKDGDILGYIARRNNCTVDEIVKWNKLKSPDAISIGQKLIIKRPKPKEPTKK